MNKRFIALNALAMLLISGTAVAQAQDTDPAPPSGPDATQTQPAPGEGSESSPDTPDPAAPAGPQETPDALGEPEGEPLAPTGFLTGQDQGQYLGSSIMNADVIESTGENIGRVDDLLIDEQGYLLGVIVGVGGFLGIGERDVAIPVDMLEIEPVGGVQGTDPDSPATGWGWWGDEQIDFIRVNVTRDELEAAPEFTPLTE